jgi:hypothetical protein
MNNSCPNKYTRPLPATERKITVVHGALFIAKPTLAFCMNPNYGILVELAR